MTKKEVIGGLYSLVLDRESFITDKTEEDDVFVEDKKILLEAIKLIQYSVPKQIIQEELKELEKELSTVEHYETVGAIRILKKIMCSNLEPNQLGGIDNPVRTKKQLDKVIFGRFDIVICIKNVELSIENYKELHTRNIWLKRV